GPAGPGVVEAALDARGEVREQVVDLVRPVAGGLAGRAPGRGRGGLRPRGLRPRSLRPRGLRPRRRAATDLERRGRGHLGAPDAAGQPAGGGAGVARLTGLGGRGRLARLRRLPERARRPGRAGRAVRAALAGLPELGELGELAETVVLPGLARLAVLPALAGSAALVERAARAALAGLAEPAGRRGLPGVARPRVTPGRPPPGRRRLRLGRRGAVARGDAADRVEDGLVGLRGQGPHLARVDDPGRALDEAARRALRARSGPAVRPGHLRLRRP